MSATTLKGAHLSLQQDRLRQFQQGSTTYRSQCTIFINGEINDYVFQQALRQLVEQHTIFQTVFYPLPGMDVPIQIMGHRLDFSCPIINLEKVAGSQQKSVLDALLLLQQEEPFNLEHGPLFRAVLFCLSKEAALLFIDVAALCADAFTLPLLIADLVKRYDACLSGHELAEESLQYAAIANWQKQVLVKEGEGAKGLHEFWQSFRLSQLSQIQKMLEQAGSGKQNSLRGVQKAAFEPLTLPLEMGESSSLHIRALSFFYNVSPQAILLACWLIVLWRLTDEPQLVIGIACNGRNYEELADALGLYMRFVPFSTSMEGDWTFQQALAFIDPLLEKTMKYQDLFSWPSAPHADDAGPEFFPVAFEYECWPASFATEKVSFSLDQQFCCTEPFMLKLNVVQMGECLKFHLHYDPQKIELERVTRLACMLQALLHSVVEQPQAPIGTLPLLTDAEQNRLLTTFKAPTRLLPAQRLHRLFEEHARRVPNQLAVMSTRDQLTYQQLNERANRLAQVLRKQGIGPNVLVGLCMARGTQMLVGLLGILKAGGAYMPLDADSPPARFSYQLRESQAAFLLTQQEISIRLPRWEGRTLCLEELEQEMSQASVFNLLGDSEAEDLAYVIYTSGSTGQPRGVMIQQSSLVNYALAVCEQLGSEAGWQYATVSTLAADLGNTAIFCGLVSGGGVQVLDYETVTSVEAMARWVEQHPFDVLKIVPSHLSALLAGGHDKKVLPRRALVLGGEVLPSGLLYQIRQSSSKCEVYNHYGPAETTIGVLINPLGALEAQEEGNQEALVTIPLGRPLINTEVYVLDQQMQVVPPGVIGELYIGGAGLAMGYIQQAELTAARFVPHIYSQQAGARLYRTGDLTRYNEKDKIEFVGRRDSQVKIRGYRIELGEIGAQLSQHPNIRDSVVVLREDLPGEPSLVGYIVPRKLPVPDHLDIQNFLHHHLPEYMVPSRFVYLKFLPLTANGKVDLRQLKKEASSFSAGAERNSALSYLIDPQNTARAIIQPRDEIEWRLLQIWEDILEIQPLSVTDDFFTVGGHSLLAVRLMSCLSKHFGCHLNLTTLFQHPTIATLAVALRQLTISEESSPLVAIQTQGSRPPFFCVHPAGGTAFCYIHLARYLGSDQPFYGLQTPDQRDGAQKLETAEALAAYYVEAIQTIQPQGPYLLGGWSLGGTLAFEMAQQLSRAGYEVSLLAIIDSVVSSAQMRMSVSEQEIDLGDASVVQNAIRTFHVAVSDDFGQKSLEEQFSYVVEQAKLMQIVPVDTSIDLVRRYVCTKIINTHIAHAYVAADYAQKIIYFLSSEHTQSNETGTDADGISENTLEPAYLQPWREVARGGLEVHRILGRHLEMMEEPHVRILAQTLRQRIDEVCRQHHS